MSELRKPDWRTPTSNTASLKYSREFILSRYSAPEPPAFCLEASLMEPILVSDPQSPVFRENAEFSHSLGPLVNSRRPAPKREPQEKLPEWFTEDHTPPHRPAFQRNPVPEPKAAEPTGSAEPPAKLVFIDKSKVKNLPPSVQEQEFSHIDELMEERLRLVIDEDDEMPEWDDPGDEGVPSQEVLGPVRYIRSFLEVQAKQGNPFAAVIIDNSMVDNTGALCPKPYSKPFEKVWHYKDPQSKVQGPFSSIQMFNWMAAGYFKEDLQIAHSNTSHFAPLYMYVMQEKGSQKQPDVEATSALKSMLGLGSPSRRLPYP